jgi:hypothetical protein
MTNKTFTVAGTSTLNGKTKIRFAADMGRATVLEKNEHTDIQLVELPTAMTKGEIAKFLFAHDDFQTVEAQTAITTYVVNNAQEVATELGLTTVAETAVEAAVEPEVEEVDAEQAKRDARNARRRARRAEIKAQEEAASELADFEI